MTATWTLDETLSSSDCGVITAREMGSTPHALDRTCTESTLWTGAVYRWNNRRSLWILHDGPGAATNSITSTSICSSSTSAWPSG